MPSRRNIATTVSRSNRPVRRPDRSDRRCVPVDDLQQHGDTSLGQIELEPSNDDILAMINEPPLHQFRRSQHRQYRSRSPRCHAWISGC